MRELFYALSQQTMYYRFMSNQRIVSRRQIQTSFISTIATTWR